MTTIVLHANHALIAGDGLICDDSGAICVETAVKVFDLGDVLFGAAGDWSKCMHAKKLAESALVDVVDYEAAVMDMAKMTGPDGADYIVSFGNGPSYAVESGVAMLIPAGEHYAIGSGKAYALGALAMHSYYADSDIDDRELLKRCVVSASDVDTNTNDEVTVVGFGDEE